MTLSTWNVRNVGIFRSVKAVTNTRIHLDMPIHQNVTYDFFDSDELESGVGILLETVSHTLGKLLRSNGSYLFQNPGLVPAIFPIEPQRPQPAPSV
jgi:hypothetical protein